MDIFVVVSKQKNRIFLSAPSCAILLLSRGEKKKLRQSKKVFRALIFISESPCEKSSCHKNVGREKFAAGLNKIKTMLKYDTENCI